jgi:16S rRNA (cytosine967-C5)-methyltransferase
MHGQNPREIATRVLGQRRRDGSFTEDLLERALGPAQLSPPDRRLCQELVYGAVRWQAALDGLIARKTDGREQKPMLQNLLRLGLYQIFWLDRVPNHAAVHETVELARRAGFSRQTGFVNGILRNYVREADLTRELLAKLKTTDPALGWSHPGWLVARWQKFFGEAKTAQLLEWNNTPPKTFARVNTLKIGEERRAGVPNQKEKSGTATRRPSQAGIIDALLEKWREEKLEYDLVRRDWLDEKPVFELKSHPSLASLASFRDGWFYVQDPSTLLAPLLLAPERGETILDYCAAPGGKTTFIAQLIDNQGQIVACDESEERLKLIQQNCARLGVTCVETISNPQSAIRNPHFDRILVDVPCSNTGVMRRRLDLRWRITPQEISRLQKKQLTLLKQAAAQLKPGGVLVYSTCSLEPEENSGVVNQFLATTKNFKLEIERQLLPFVDGMDGAYVAVLKSK